MTAPVHLEPATTSGKKAVSWAPFRPERVAEPAYERMENRARFRHTARFRRWRPDRTPESCTAIRPAAGDDDALRLRLRLDGG